MFWNIRNAHDGNLETEVRFADAETFGNQRNRSLFLEEKKKLLSVNMQEIVAPVSAIRFDIEIALEQQIGSLPLPFPGMDSKLFF